jgi:hypothetical protein
VTNRQRRCRGEHGEHEPLTPALRQALFWLFIATFTLIGLGFYGLYRVQKANEEQVARVALVNSRQRCSAIAEAAAIPVPVPTAGNPSRVWVARFSLIERHRGEQLGCVMPPPSFVSAPP